MSKLEGKIAFITGAGSGMGQEQAKLFSEEGAKVILADINLNGTKEVIEEIKENDKEAISVEIDVSDKESVEKAVNEALEVYGKIDILSNTAGVLDDYAPTLETSEDLWNDIIGINLKGVYLVTNAILPQMLDRNEGIIINFGSLASFVAGGGGAAYTASKHGVAGYTKQLAFDYASQGIRANAIAPGSIETSLTEDILVEGSDEKESAEDVPVGRLGQPEEVAQAALFLASEGASFVHGEILTVDGGWTIQ